MFNYIQSPYIIVVTAILLFRVEERQKEGKNGATGNLQHILQHQHIQDNDTYYESGETDRDKGSNAQKRHGRRKQNYYKTNGVKESMYYHTHILYTLTSIYWQ